MSDLWSTLRLFPYFMCANSESPWLWRDFAGRLCDKYHNVMSWHIYLCFNRFYCENGVSLYSYFPIFPYIHIDTTTTDNNGAATWQNQQNECAPSLIRVFAVRSVGSWGPKVSSCGQQRLWSDLAWSESSLCAEWVAKDPRFLHAGSKDSDQTGRMPRLIWVFAGRTLILLVLSCRGSTHGDNSIAFGRQASWMPQAPISLTTHVVSVFCILFYFW